MSTGTIYRRIPGEATTVRIYRSQHIETAEPTQVIELTRPVGYRARHRRPRNRTFLHVSMATLLGAAFAAGCADGAPDTPAGIPPGNPPISVETAQPLKPGEVSEGTFEVGTDVTPGTYTTTLPAGESHCYWARLKNLDGELSGVIANGNLLTPGAKGRVVVKPSDKGVEFRGGCVWTKAAAK